MYIEFLLTNRRSTMLRRIVNRALQSLPVTQHNRIWDIVINKFIYQDDFPVAIATCKKLYSRYIQIEPSSRDPYVDFLIQKEEFTDAVIELIRIVESEEEGASMNYFKLIGLLSQKSDRLNPHLVNTVDLPGIIRAGLSRFPDELGNLWNSLADYYIRMGMFGRAIEIYEEALSCLSTVSDFSIVFNSYQNFLDLIIKMRMEMGGENPNLQMDLERLELLVDRRSELLSSVLLRQNPNNVTEWIKRTKLPRIASNPDLVVKTFTNALMTVGSGNDAESESSAVGRISTLWTEFARYYFIILVDLEAGRSVFEKAIQYPFKSADDLANVWIEWILLEVKLAIIDVDTPEPERWRNVVEVSRRAISQYRGSPKGTVQSQLFKSVKLWNLALDIEESLNGANSPELVRGIYETMMDLKVITPLLLLAFARFELSKNFEKSLQILEKGIEFFPWPHKRDILVFYLETVIKNPRGRNLSTERIRDLYEQAISDCPKKFAGNFYFSFFKFEINHGLARSAISILTRAATLELPTAEKSSFYYLAISETMRLLGGGASRKIFEDAIAAFTDAKLEKQIVEFCLEYCRLEQELGEIKRARKLLEHASQFANPKNSNEFWEFWKNFEIQNGDETSFKEMKRSRRTVEVLYSDRHFNTIDTGMEMSEEEGIIVEDANVSVSAAPVLTTGGIDLAKLKQSALRYKAGEPTGVTGGEGFSPSQKFSGSRPGYVFTTRSAGTGYYRDI